jgi:hypothetical protein
MHRVLELLTQVLASMTVDQNAPWRVAKAVALL